jgi:hypothetical protein
VHLTSVGMALVREVPCAGGRAGPRCWLRLAISPVLR